MPLPTGLFDGIRLQSPGLLGGGPPPPPGVMARGRPPQGRSAPPQQGRRQPNFLDRILGLYGADPATHIPEDQRKQALSRGLMRGGLATVMAGGRGHDSLTPGQAIGTMLGTMQQTGPTMAAEGRQAQLRQALEQANGNPEVMRQMMMKLIAAGDYEGARSVSEVLKSMTQSQDDRYIKVGDGLLYDTETQQYIPWEGRGEEVAGFGQNLAHPEGLPGQYRVPYNEEGEYDWSKAALEGEDPYQARERRMNRERQVSEDYEKKVKSAEGAMRFIATGLNAVELARARSGGGDLEISGPEQINLLYAFIKGIDPESVVRTGEIDLAREAASLSDKIQGFIDKWFSGESVIVPGRMIQAVEQMLAAHQEAQRGFISDQREHALGLANRWGIADAENLVRDPTENITPYTLDEVSLYFQRDEPIAQASNENLTPEQLADKYGARRE